MKVILFLIISTTAVHLSYGAEKNIITIEKNKIIIQADILKKVISLDHSSLSTKNIEINDTNISSVGAGELSFSFHYASPNEQPLGITAGAGTVIDQSAGIANSTDILKISGDKQTIKQNVSWIKIANLKSGSWGEVFNTINYTISEPAKGVKRLNVRVRSANGKILEGIAVNLFYEIYENYPAIRKWVEITNNSPKWLKIDSLTTDDLILSAQYGNITELTPAEWGASSSIISFSNKEKSEGVIIGSEVPSALRFINRRGATGYAPEFFEWVIGPTEKFISEPVFMYAYQGENISYQNSISTSLDRAVEGPFKQFLYDIIGLKKANMSTHTPIWCSWSNFGPYISDANIREMADIAGKAGIKTMILDAGWAKTQNPGAWATSSTIPDEKKFPDFKKTADYLTGKGINLGLWVSCYRNPDMAPDFKTIQNGFSLPLIKRGEGVAMSFASTWRHYYADNIIYLHDRYGASYFKQDLTNIKFGDIAFGHDSRTQKESLLRGLRGLLESMDEVSHSSPDISMEITHEIYWGTPGVPCDLAVLKHVNSYHIPPNDYSGSGNRSQRLNDSWKFNSDSLRERLIKGCFNARKSFYAHRSLPLQSIEYYGAAMLNFNGSLSPEVQKRQVCSWLMGVPSVFAGDLASLTEENIETYKKCFDLLERLNNKYHIYENFQFSGVPAPTDTDWHWWGKLNDEGYGAIVVLRGKEGSNQKKINIPWVQKEKKYRLQLCFSGKELGLFTGNKLINGKVELELEKNSQEIIEIMPVR
ncbi:MAG: hypothetical protein A2W90_22665 [Bacteroidetes bacterium GWF2_42_66]|nr:MAG: hypothetical protein A2W92_22070 [Bacteroidetes bacterium GWA2_42_15]OFY03133.1 MAG: hypothetical protein A2W89_13445 [Bacteroidetes bacterium GWE2_42_39]OFY45241.1 MAG: hypothetical protein A2W90_22665 [Bacteroidetes bacterium GWF2_42_66]HAZ02137.1 hypothetical protein [Marinilabiliales bacterium]HBL74100.1 hypothetical protein [Prolixibacteraceae bacterium]